MLTFQRTEHSCAASFMFLTWPGSGINQQGSLPVPKKPEPQQQHSIRMISIIQRQLLLFPQNIETPFSADRF